MGKIKKDSLGDRMKGYENTLRLKLPRRSYTIIRVDGKAFHSFTKGLARPFDSGLISDMDATAMYICKNVQCAKFAFVQSDEISIFISDFDDINTEAWFDNNLQKMCSVSASFATSKFNQLRLIRKISLFDFANFANYEYDDIRDLGKLKLAEFDSRVFQIPQAIEVENYFIWRQQDAVRNSISSVAQSLYSTKELHGKNSDQQQELIFQKGINWNDYSFRQKRGGIIMKVEDSNGKNTWQLAETPIFTQERDFLRNLIPKHE